MGIRGGVAAGAMNSAADASVVSTPARHVPSAAIDAFAK
jgi:hypothetical protein